MALPKRNKIANNQTYDKIFSVLLFQIPSHINNF